MSTREKALLIAFLAIIGGGGMLFIGKQWFLDPLRGLNAKIELLTDENEKLDSDIWHFERERKRMDLARRKSLPANPELAGSEYINYLKSLLQSSGLGDVYVNRSLAPSELKMASLPPGIKKIGHQVLTFQVRAKGEWRQWIKAMEEMQKTPYEHRIKNLTIDRLGDSSGAKAGPPKVNINMSVEALLVADSKGRAGIPPGFDPAYLVLDGIAAQAGGVAPLGWGLVGTKVVLMQAMPMPADRKYAEIARRNIFVGAQPDVILPPPSAPTDNVPKWVHLIHTVPSQNTAYFKNRVYKTRDIKLIAKPQSGYEFFRITDEEGDYVYFKGKVLRVDSRDVYYQVRKDVYCVHIGQSLADAMEYPLTIDQLDDLGLYDLIDRDWAQQEMGEATGKSTSKKTGFKGGKTGKGR